MEGTGDPESLGQCLLQWVQSFNGKGEVKSLDTLADGLALWAILKDIDEGYFVGQLPEPEVIQSSDWTRKWQNLKHIEKQVAMYYRDICSGQERINIDSLPDVKAIAADSSKVDTEKLIMAIIRAAMASPETNQHMAQRLMSLGRQNAMLIANALRNMEEAEYTESEPASRDESAYHSEQDVPDEPKANGDKAGRGIYQDPLLEREEQLLQAQATIERLEASHLEAQRQLQELRQEKDMLEEAFDVYRNEIDTKGRKTGGDDDMKKLQRQADNDRAYIDDLENQLQSVKGAMENHELQFQRYKDDNEAGQKLRDEVQLLKADNEDLNQKVRANENLKKKIQTLQEQEKANVTLREEIKQANERLESLDRAKKVQASLEKEIIEKQGLIRNQEYQINELTTTRKHAEHDARVLTQKLQEARERHDRDHETIQELRGTPQEPNTDESQVSTFDAKQDETMEEKPKTVALSSDENQHLAEKVTLLQQQLETADIRLKQASERNAMFEEQQRGMGSDADALRKAEEQLQAQEHTIASLRKEVEVASTQKPAGPKAPQDLAALQRENTLMATAWYDLSSRLQNNGVSLSRRRPEPKSWIGKQRALVGPSSTASR